jgi:hypothetical protein
MTKEGYKSKIDIGCMELTIRLLNHGVVDIRAMVDPYYEVIKQFVLLEKGI